MFKFLFRGLRGEPEVAIETQRETFFRLIDELNQAIDKLADKPKVTVDPATGHILLAAPEQFPDEALALPGPETESAPEQVEDGVEDAPQTEEATGVEDDADEEEKKESA